MPPNTPTPHNQIVSYETVMGMCYMMQQDYIEDHRNGVSGNQSITPCE
jgi:hypothetical protein